MSITVTKTLDLKGWACPLPIVKTAKAMKELASGEVVEVLATDPGSVQDFKAWSTATRNEIVETSEDDGVYRYVIRKR